MRPVLDEPSADRIEVDIPADGPIVALILDEFGPVPSLEQVPDSTMSSSMPDGIRREELLHAPRKIGARRLEEQVQVVLHEYEGEQFPAAA